jgi:tripartite-type tricarboxylate transporter receptor subunit TctC
MRKMGSHLSAALIWTLAGAIAWAQDYPNRPIRLVVPYPPGGATDIIARTLSQKLLEELGQQVIVDNRPGGGQILGSEIVAKAAPNGYTVLLASVTHGINPGLVPKLPYDSVRDFTPISMVATSPNVLVVNARLPVRTVKELIALAKARPGQLNYASSGNGSGGHLAMELFRSMTGIAMIHVPYKGAGPALTELIAGQVQLMFTSPLAALPHVRTGKLRVLGVASTKRAEATPEIMTIAEAGVPGFEAPLWYAILGPAGVPDEMVARLNGSLKTILAMRDVRERFSSNGVDAAYSTPGDLAAHIGREIEKWRKVISASGIRPD